MATPATRPISREVFVEIIIDQNGRIMKVDPDPFWVSKGNDEEVVFRCVSSDPDNPHPNFKVRFDKQKGSPFYESEFGQDCPCSGLVRRDVVPDESPKGIYGYTVVVGGAFLDPGGGVKP